MDANFPLELDHIAVWVKPKAPEAEILAEFGLQRTGYAEHRGQGTASYFFLFDNVYLELIWINEEQTALDNMARTGIDWRSRASWRETGASAFAVGWHRREPTAIEELPLFPVKYSAEWMEPGTYIEFSDNFNQTTEPFYFIVPEYISVPQRLAPEKRIAEPIAPHPLGIKNLTSARVTLPQRGELSPVASELSRHTRVAFEPGNDSLLELTFDGGSRGQTLDARPTLPIVFNF